MKIFFSLKPRNFFSLIKAFNWFAADLQVLMICNLKLCLLLIWISTSNSAEDTTFIFWSSTTWHCILWSLFLLSNKRAWIFSRLTIILLFLNQSMTISDPDCNMSINSKIVSDNVLSSAKLRSETSDTKN